LSILCEAVCLFFITLGKWKQAPKKEMIDQATKRIS